MHKQERMIKSMFQTSISLFPLILCLMSFQHTQIFVSSSQDEATSLITNACNHSRSPDHCTKFLDSAPRNQKTNLKGLAFFTLKLAKRDAARTTLYIEKILQNSPDHLPPFIQQAISNCKQHYTSLVDLIDDSIDTAISEAFGDVKKLVKAAAADAEEFRESLAEGRTEILDSADQFEKRTKKLDVEALKFLLDIALSIARAGIQD